MNDNSISIWEEIKRENEIHVEQRAPNLILKVIFFIKVRIRKKVLTFAIRVTVWKFSHNVQIII